MNNYSTEQLQKIVDDAPEGAEFWSVRESSYYCDKRHYVSVWGDIKLSDIRAELLGRQFKVGDRVIVEFFRGRVANKNHFMNKVMTVFKIDAVYTHVEVISDDYNHIQLNYHHNWFRPATAEEKAAGHRIDSNSPEFDGIKTQPDTCKWQFQDGGYSTACGAGVHLESKHDSIFYYCCYCGKRVDVEHKPDTITTQLDPAKCRLVDPTVYEAPTDSPRDDFDAMSESHRSPACKCHEFPFDAELIPDAVNHPPHYTSDPSGIECIEITRHRNFNVGNAIKYLWRAGRKDQAATVQDLQKAIWYINDEIERLEGEQGE